MASKKADLPGNKIETIREQKKEWEKRLKKTEQVFPPRPEKFTTVSDMEVPLFSTPDDLEDEEFDYLKDSGFPGEYPFTRGVQRNMYRGKLWTMRQFAGFASAEETNKRFKLLLAHGQ